MPVSYSERAPLPDVAMLPMAWFDEPFRGTRDLDFLGRGDPAPEAVLDVFREILGQEQPGRGRVRCRRGSNQLYS